MSKIDKLDRQILRMIAEDARVPFLEVARACNVSGAAIHQRIQKLTAMGVLKGSQFLIDPEKIGYETCAYIGLNLKDPGSFDEVVEKLKDIPEVVECHYTTGNFDMFIKLYALNNHHLLTIIHDQLQPLGLASSQTLISFHSAINRQLPVEAVLNVTEEDLDKESFDIFKREAIRSGRMSEDDLRLSRIQLLESLNLYDDGKLKRAAILLFHRNPEKWITGSWVKIGYFLNDADIRYQDEIHGSLMMQAERTIDLLYTKYLIAEISYDNITRIEHYPYPKDAVREAIFNALIHQDFSAGIPVQISVYSDKLYISNDCVFPDTWTAETLMQKHRSLPHNPDIANTFFRAGFIESWGRGIEKICTLCKNYGIPEPEYTVHPGDIMLKFISNNAENAVANDALNTGIVEKSVRKIIKTKEDYHTNNIVESIAEDIVESIAEKLSTMRGRIVKIVWKNPYASARTISEEVGIAPRNVQEHLRNLQVQGIIRRVGPDKGGHWEIIGNNSNNTE